MKTIIFFFFLTILNTLVDLKNAVNHGLKTYNLPEKDLEFIRTAIGNGTQVLIKRCTPECLSDEERSLVFASFKNLACAIGLHIGMPLFSSSTISLEILPTLHMIDSTSNP